MPWLLMAAAPTETATGGWQSVPTTSAPAATMSAPVLRRDLPPPPSAPVLRTSPSETPVASAPLPTPTPAPVPAPPLRAAPSTPPASVASAPPLRIAPADPQPVALAPSLRPETPARSYEPQRINFAEGVTASFDIPFQALPGFRPLTLDVYQPRRSGPLPLVVFVHGGGFQGGDSRHAGTFEDFPRELAALAARGYVVASVNYRLSGEARFPAAVQDIKAAIRWLGSRAGAYGIDPTRIAVWGAGAGGQLAALTGVTCGVGMFEPVSGSPASDCVQAVIDWSGATDLNTLATDNGKPAAAGTGFAPPPSSDSGAFLGCEPANCPPVMARLASPLGYIKATSPPFLIQHGGADTSISSKQAQKFHDALKAAGVPVQLVIYPGVGAEFRRDGAPDPATNAQALQQVAGFLAATFPYAPLAAPAAAAKAAPPMRRTVQN